MKKFCENCGKELDENADFCVGCGKKVNEQPKETPAKKKMPTWLIVVIVIAVIGVIGAIAIGGDEEEPKKEPDNEVNQPSDNTPEIKEFTKEYASGNYVAGIDFPAGEYDIVAVKGNGNVSSSNMYTGGLNAIMGVKDNDTYEKEYKNVKLPNGTTLKITGVEIKIISKKITSSKMDKREQKITKEYTLSSGNYTSGTDFEPGTYNIKAVKGNGNVSSSNMFSGGLNAIMGIKNDEIYILEYKNIELPKNTTLKLSGVEVKITPSK